MTQLVRTVYPEYGQEEMVEIDYKAIRKLNHTQNNIPMDEYNEILQVEKKKREAEEAKQ